MDIIIDGSNGATHPTVWIMEKKKSINTLEWIRRIRDQQAKELEGKSNSEIIEYCRSASQALRRDLNIPDSSTASGETQADAEMR